MAIGYRATGAASGRSGTGSLSVAVPAGTASGDLLLLVATSNNNQTPAASGWTTAALSPQWFVSGYHTILFWKIAGASEPSATVTTPGTSSLEAVMLGFTGVDTTTPFDVAMVWGTAVSGGTVTVASVTTLTANTWWVVVAADDTGTALTSSSKPAGWTQRALTTATVVSRFACNTIAVPAAGVQTATSYTKSTGNVMSGGLALRESGAGASTFVPRIQAVY